MLRFLSLSCVVLFLLCTSSALAHSHSGGHGSRSPIEWMSGYTMVLVDANSKEELLAARDFIMAQGGTVSVLLPPHTIFGWVTPEVGSRIIGRHKIRSLHRSPVEPSATGFRDSATVIAIRSFNDVASGRSAARTMREIADQSANPASRPAMPDCALPKPQIDRGEFIRNLRSMGGGQAASLQSTVTPQFWNNSDVMDGTVAVAAFLMESNGNIDTNVFNWSQADQDLAIAQIIQGLNWWVDQSRAFTLARPLQFTLVPFLPNNPAAQVPYEPALREGRNSHVWINHIMRNMGGSSNDQFVNVASFNRVLKEQNRTDWAFTIFMAYNPAPSQTSFADGRASWAYIGGPHTNTLFRSFGWAINQTISHEVGHIFFACDEYSQPGFQSCSCSCAPEVRPAAKNGNCEDFNCNANATACIMRLNEAALCPFTVAQIGWAASVPKPLPSAPTSLVATAASPTVVNLIWQDTSRDTPGTADGFQIERRGGTSAEFAQIGVVSAAGGDSPGFSDSTVLPNTAYSYRVRAFNLSGVSSFSNEAAVVTPITPSSLSVSTTEMPAATVDVSYSKALTAVGGASNYTWQIDTGTLPPGLSLSQTGTVSGIATTAGAYNFVVRVTDSDNNRATKALSITVRPAAPLTITTLQLPRASVGTPYSQTLGASGGQTPYTWSVQSGALPEGLVLNQSGTISGIPDRAGSSSFVLRLTDAANATQTATLSMIVNPGSVQLAIETESLPDGVVGQDYSQALEAVGGTAPYAWEIVSGTLPSGISISESGVISGRPAAPGEAIFEVQARDQSGQSVRASLSIDVDPAAQLTILNETLLPPAAVGVPYNVELKATSGTAPYTWNKKKKAKFGNFPPGITMSPQGVLSGTPTAQGMSNFTVNVKDSASKTASKPLQIEVGPPPAPLAVRTETLSNATQQLPYQATLEADGGVGPYTWTLETGALPDGLALAPDGNIAGRATTLGSVSFIVRLRDSLGTFTTKSLFIVVIPPPPPLVIQTISLPETFAERPYSQTLQASGGLPPYSWSLVSGNIGSGLNLSVDGVISGTPMVPGLSVFVIRVTDSAQQTVSRTLAINIKPADKIVPFGDLETPGFRATLTNMATGSGWALDNTGVTLIEVLVDGEKVGQAIYGLPRPDVATVWGNFPNGGTSGFSFTFDTRQLSNGEHRVSVRIIDASGNATVVGNRPVNVQNQVLAITTLAVPSGKKGDFYSTQLTAINGRVPYTWELNSGALPQGISLNLSGLISGTPSVFGVFPFSARVRDSAGATAVANYSLTINPDVLQLVIVSRGEQAEASINAEYSLQLLGAGGSPPRVWSLASGSLPPGLSLSPSGIISGRPTQMGHFVFTVRLSDSAGANVTSEISIRVIQPLAIGNAASLAQGTVGVAYSHQFTGSGGDAPYLWNIASGALPAGMAINFTTGTISGIPTQSGTFTFTVRMIDAVFRTVNSSPVTLVIAPQPAEPSARGFSSLSEGEGESPEHFMKYVGLTARLFDYWRAVTG
ncbi:MAG TPA: putative Ig domain-containing protein [Blastocatellia bacterium]|nr:putative Ig domain-containing protein [Blastocatellia bacterium]